MAGILGEASPGILGWGWQSGGILGQGDPYTGYYPTRYAVPGQTAPADKVMGGVASVASLPVRVPFQMGMGIGHMLDQANQAMPWGGNDPSAIGLDVQRGEMDPSVMVPFAADVAGMATTGALAAPPVAGVGMGIKAYHASPYDFEQFKPSEFRGATFFAGSPNRAREGAVAAQNEMIMDTATRLPPTKWRTYEVDIDPSKIEGLALRPKELEWFKGLPDEIVGDDAFDKVWDTRPPEVSQWDRYYDAEKIGERLYRYTKKPEPPTVNYEDAYTNNRDVYGQQFPHYSQQGSERKTADRVIADGMGGWLVQDEAGLSIAVADPSIARIVGKNILSSNPKESAAIGAGILGGQDKTGIRAYHGSPHDFDRFSMDKIGTGEGAQAYGHGLYFAEHPDVAGQYKDNLATYKHIRDFNDANPQNRPGQVAQWQASGMELERMDDALKILEPNSTQAMRDDWLRQGQKLHDEMASRGRMYEVNINASPDEFLDWDKPLSEQSGLTVDKIVERLPTSPPSGGMAIEASAAEPASQISGLFNASGVQFSAKREANGYRPVATPGPDAPANLRQRVYTETFPTREAAVNHAKIKWLAGLDGQRLVGELERLYGRERSAEILRSAGIKGIRYKDAGSRNPDPLLDGKPIPDGNTAAKLAAEKLSLYGSVDAALQSFKGNVAPYAEQFNREAEELIRSGRVAVPKEGGTSNYVVFSDDIISILKKYGIAGLMAGGAGAAMLGGSQDASASQPTYSTGGRF